MNKLTNKTFIIFTFIRCIYLVALITFGLLGIYLNVSNSINGFGVFSYYTIQSNALCIIASLLYITQLFYHKKIHATVMATIQGGIVMCIMLTFLVFHFLLLPVILADSEILGPGNMYVHYILPLMILGDYMLFQKKGMFTFSMIWLWTLVPISYCIFVYIFSAFGGRFGSDGHLVPYFFLDYTRFGVGGVALWILALALGYLTLSTVLIILDRLIVKCSNWVKQHKK